MAVLSSRIASRHASGGFVAAVLTLMSLGAAAAANETSAPSQPVEAAWKQRDISFTYRSSQSIYSCSALRSRVASVLRAVGVRDDMQIRVDGCDEFSGGPGSRSGSNSGFDVRMDRGGSMNDRYGSSRLSSDRDRGQFAHVSVRIHAVVEATPEVLAAIEKDRPRRELLARVSGNAAAAFEDAGTFPARRLEVELSHKSIGLEAEECELLEQMSNNLFRQLKVRIVRRSMLCNPRESSRIPPQLTVEALMFAPVGSYIEAKKPAPASAPASAPAPAAPATPTEPAPAEQAATTPSETPPPK